MTRVPKLGDEITVVLGGEDFLKRATVCHVLRTVGYTIVCAERGWRNARVYFDTSGRLFRTIVFDGQWKTISEYEPVDDPERGWNGREFAVSMARPKD